MDFVLVSAIIAMAAFSGITGGIALALLLGSKARYKH